MRQLIKPVCLNDRPVKLPPQLAEIVLTSRNMHLLINREVMFYTSLTKIKPMGEPLAVHSRRPLFSV